MLRFPPSYIAWAVLNKAFALTRAHGSRGLARSFTSEHQADGAGGSAPPVTTVLDLPGLPPVVSHLWSPCPEQMHECAQCLDRLYREHKGEAEEEMPASNGESEVEAEVEAELEAEANAEVAAFDKPSTPGASARLQGVTPNGIEAADEIFGDPHESGSGVPVGVAHTKPAAAAVSVPAVGSVAGVARAARQPMTPAGHTEAEAAASNKRRKLAGC